MVAEATAATAATAARRRSRWSTCEDEDAAEDPTRTTATRRDAVDGDAGDGGDDDDDDDDGRRRRRRAVEDDSSTKRRRRSRWEATDGGGGGDVVVVDDRAVVATRDGGGAAAAAGRVASLAATTSGAIPKDAIVVGSGVYVQLPTSVLAEHSAPAGATAEVHFLFRELGALNRRLFAGAPYDDDDADAANGREPAPVYDDKGVRVNTREAMEREKFHRRRMALLEEICLKCPTFRPPPDYKPNKRSAKLIIPVDEYPGYNFFGLIIGPRGSTQKRMQAETNTKIVIRGKGSAKGGTGAAERNNAFEHEPLHVLIEGDTQSDVDKAKAMIEKLLIPVDEDANEHKRQQLRELALMNGTLRDEGSIEAMQKRLDEEMANGSVYQLPEAVKKAVEATYRKDVEKMHGFAAAGATGLDSAYSDFLSELGVEGRGKSRRADESEDDDRKIFVGRLPNTATAEELMERFKDYGCVENVACIPDVAMGYSCKGFAFITFKTPEEANAAVRATNGTMFGDRPMEVRMKTAPREEPRGEFDADANLYVSGLPESAHEDYLRDLFAPYGLVQKTKIIRDHATQVPRGYGFVQMMDPAHAQNAIASLNGQLLPNASRPLTVRIAGQHGNVPPPQPAMMSNVGFSAPVSYGFATPYATPFADAPMIDPSMAAFYGANPYAVSYDMPYAAVAPTVELGNPDDAPPPPPDEEGAPPPPLAVAPAAVLAEDIVVVPGVAPPAPPPLPPPPN